MNSDIVTPELLYQFLVLKSLIANGGSLERNRVLSYIKLHHSNLLTRKDLDDYDSGHGERWKNHISFARQHLIEKECLARNSPHGLWEITDQGRQQYVEWVDALKIGFDKSGSNG